MMWISSALSFIKGLDIRIILLILVFAISGFAILQTNRANQLKDQLQVERYNIEAMQDSVRSYKTLNGELGKEKLALQTNVEQLEIANEELHDELQKEKDNVKFITKTKIVVEHDTVYVDSNRVSEIGMGNYKISWSYNKSGDGWSKSLKGYTSFKFDSTNALPYGAITAIENDQLNLSIVTGIREKDGKMTIFVRSNYPNIDFVEIDGAIINPDRFSSPKRWSIGPSIGYGYMPEVGFKPYIGASLQYSIIR